MSEVYTVVLMSGKWYAMRFDEINDLVNGRCEIIEQVSEHVDQGAVVAICDDLETFKEEMKLSDDSLIIVDPDEEDV